MLKQPDFLTCNADIVKEYTEKTGAADNNLLYWLRFRSISFK